MRAPPPRALLWALVLAAGPAAGVVSDPPPDDGDSAPEPAAVFCDYACGPGKPSRPGVCFREDIVFKTQRQGWLLFKTRFPPSPDPLDPPPAVLPKWAELIQGDMTWEGYFRVASAPPATSSLMGTYGANHDTDLFYIDVNRRRRHTAVWIDAYGALSMNTNVGTSSGHIDGPNVVVTDGKWHHIAAVFEHSGGGARVTFSMKVDQVEFALLEPAQLVPAFSATVKRVVALAADTGEEHISLTLEEGFVKPLRAVWVHFSINVAPEAAVSLRNRLTIVPWLAGAVSKAVMETPRMYNAIPTGFDTIVVTSVITLPLIKTAGSARLYVDGFPGIGAVTYVPQSDNIGMDGQLVVAGGHQGRAFEAEVSRFRVWEVPLAQSQIQMLRACVPPSLQTLVGGAYPHGLRANYALNGTYADAAGTGFQGLEGVKGGQFGIGGLCSIDRCPETSAGGCMHVPERELHFDSMQKCEAFAQFVHCRVAGGNRGRPADLMGCGASAA